MERERTIKPEVAAYQRKLEFLRRAKAEGADDIVPPHVEPQDWNRMRDIGKANAYLSYPQEELGNIWGGITKEAISWIAKRFLEHLYFENVSVSLRQEFTFAEISVRKPLTQRTREESSKSQGGVSFMIKEQLDRGITDAAQIAKNTGLSQRQIKESRKHVLGGWDVELPEEFFQRKHTLWTDFEKEIKQETDDKKLQETLDNISMPVVMGHIQRGKTNQTPVFLDFLMSVLRGKGLHVRSKDMGLIHAVIKDAGIPIKKECRGYQANKNGQEYPQVDYIVITRHTDRIVNALKANPELFARLNNNPVKLAYGPNPDKYPNTTQLKQKGQYVGIGNIIARHFGLIVYSGNYPDLLASSPASVFSLSSKGGCFCSLGDLDILLPFLEQRLKDLGKIK